jgi:hypothetical protein
MNRLSSEPVLTAGSERYFLGLDLGQSQDFTALVALCRRTWRLPTGKTEQRFAARGIRRWPLGTLYTDIAKDIAALTARAPAGRNANPLSGCVLGIDGTGVGKGVLEIIRAAKPCAKLVTVVITGGHSAHADGLGWHVPKKELVGAVMAVLQSRRLEIPGNLAEAKTLEKELLAFRAKITAKGNEQFEVDWRSRNHDDLVLALAIAAWLAQQEQPATIKPRVILPGPDILRGNNPGMPALPPTGARAKHLR